ncbi:MAG TPA: hypothetical protein VJC12_00965 [Candidatus Paceibacterota bacterium]
MTEKEAVLQHKINVIIIGANNVNRLLTDAEIMQISELRSQCERDHNREVISDEEHPWCGVCGTFLKLKKEKRSV